MSFLLTPWLLPASRAPKSDLRTKAVTFKVGLPFSLFQCQLSFVSPNHYYCSPPNTPSTIHLPSHPDSYTPPPANRQLVSSFAVLSLSLSSERRLRCSSLPTLTYTITQLQSRAQPQCSMALEKCTRSLSEIHRLLRG